MKAVVQRVSCGSIVIDGAQGGEIQQGLMILLGVVEGDTKEQADYLAEKIVKLRIFSDSEDKLNLSLLDINGEALIVSNFTLCGNSKKGNRPSYSSSAPPLLANELYEYFVSAIQVQINKKVVTGKFGADMQVSITNDGPVTIILDTQEIMPKK